MRRASTLSSFQVEDGALLAAIPSDPGGMTTKGIARGRFDLDHLSAEISENSSGKSTSHTPAEVQNEKFIAGSSHLVISFRSNLTSETRPD
jgi:hypothetical protein